MANARAIHLDAQQRLQERLTDVTTNKCISKKRESRLKIRIHKNSAVDVNPP